jgi:hypothetical protein
MAEKRGIDVDDEPEAQVLPERELMLLVAPDASPEDVPAPEADKPPDDGTETQSSPSQ